MGGDFGEAWAGRRSATPTNKMTEMSIVPVVEDDDEGTVSMNRNTVGGAGSARANVTFHVAINPDAVRIGEGERLTLHGSIPVSFRRHSLLHPLPSP